MIERFHHSWEVTSVYSRKLASYIAEFTVSTLKAIERVFCATNAENALISRAADIVPCSHRSMVQTEFMQQKHFNESARETRFQPVINVHIDSFPITRKTFLPCKKIIK